MFIRRTNTRNRKTGEAYFTHRLVETARVGNSVKQCTLLNLGVHFDVPQGDWQALAARIDELLRGQSSLLVMGLTEALETHAQRYAAQLIARQARDGAADDAPAEAAEASRMSM